jgi:hypothetical protein
MKMMRNLGQAIRRGAVAAASKKMAPAMGGAVASASKKAAPMMAGAVAAATKKMQPAIGAAVAAAKAAQPKSEATMKNQSDLARAATGAIAGKMKQNMGRGIATASLGTGKAISKTIGRGLVGLKKRP